MTPNPAEDQDLILKIFYVFKLHEGESEAHRIVKQLRARLSAPGVEGRGDGIHVDEPTLRGICERARHLLEPTPPHRRAKRRGSEMAFRKGERHHNAKLTEDNVREMRFMHDAGFSMRSIGKQFNVSSYTARLAIKGITWKHVSAP